LGANAFNEIVQCAEREGCVDAAGQFDEFCLLDECPGQMEQCFGPQALPQGVMSCMEINVCYNGCENAACHDRCTEEAAENSLNLLRRLQACVQRNNCADFDCINERCGEDYLACRRDSSGIADCQDISDCYFRCRDEDCQLACFYDGQIPSQDTFGVLVECMAESGCNQPNDCPACAMEAARCEDDRGEQ